MEFGGLSKSVYCLMEADKTSFSDHTGRYTYKSSWYSTPRAKFQCSQVPVPEGSSIEGGRSCAENHPNAEPWARLPCRSVQAQHPQHSSTKLNMQDM